MLSAIFPTNTEGKEQEFVELIALGGSGKGFTGGELSEDIVARLVNRTATKSKTFLKEYLKTISAVKGSFGPELEKENKQIRVQVEERLKRLQF